MRAAIVAIVTLSVCASALGEGSLTVRVSDRKVEVGQPFIIWVEAAGARVGDVEMPEVDGLVVQSQPVSKSTGMQFVLGGGMTTTLKLGYEAKALKEGSIEIPPFVAKIDGREVRSASVSLLVVKEPGGMDGGGDAGWDDKVFIEVEADKTAAYQGEPVSLRFTFWQLDDRALQLTSRYSLDAFFPTTEGFYAIPQVPQKLGRAMAQKNGRDYVITQWRQTLYPTGAGAVTIGSWRCELRAVDYRGYSPKTHDYNLESPPIQVEVKSLPERPDGFSGAVGQFDIGAEISPPNTVQNMPITMVVRIVGTGNPDAIGEPLFPTIDGAYIADPEPSVHPINDPEGVTSEKAFSYQITPVRVGVLTIPPVEFCYFDPATAAYETKKTDPFSVNVQASGEQDRRVLVGEDVGREAEKVEVLGQDIMPIIADAGTLRPSGRFAAAVPALYVGAPLAYAAFALFMMRKRRFEVDTGFARSYRAKARLHKRLAQAAKSAEPTDELYRALVGYLADKFNLPEAGMTSSDVRNLLDSRGIDDELTGRILKILRTSERARYASASLSPDEVGALIQGSRECMDRLDAMIRQEGGR